MIATYKRRLRDNNKQAKGNKYAALFLPIVGGIVLLSSFYQNSVVLTSFHLQQRSVKKEYEIKLTDLKDGNETTIITTAVDTRDDFRQRNHDRLKENIQKILLEPPFQHKPPKTIGAFLHLGKAGGSTISKLLRHGCHAFVRKPCNRELMQQDQSSSSSSKKESHMSKLTTYYHVPDFETDLLKTNHKLHDYQFFAITMRDPLSRAISSYKYGHPNSCAALCLEQWQIVGSNYFKKYVSKFGYTEELFAYVKGKRFHGPFMMTVPLENIQMYECFDTLDEYANLLSDFDSEYNSNSSMTWQEYRDKGDCANLAKYTLRHLHHKQALQHNYWDLREILFQVHPGLTNKTILALRQEYLSDDWTSTNHYLGQEGHVYFGNSSSASRVYEAMNFPKNLTVSSYLSVSGRKYLCLALKEEYQLYLRILVLSRNLSREHIEQSLSLARKNCPDLNLRLPLVDEKVEIVMSRSRGSYKL